MPDWMDASDQTLHEHLTGVEDSVRIHGSLDCPHQFDRRRSKRDVKEGGLGVSYAVFAGNRSAKRDRALKNLAHRAVTGIALLLIIPLEHNVDVHVAVAGMPESRYRKSVPRTDVFNEGEQLRYPRTRDDNILIDLPCTGSFDGR